MTERVADLTSVIVVACDSGPLLVDCVASVLASSVPVEAIISDNASRDGSIEALSSRWPHEPRLQILRNGANLGFGAGCNRGAALARGNMLLFLNPDCRVESDTIARLRAHMDARIGVLGAMIVDAGGKPESASRRRDPLLRRCLMTALRLARWEARWPVLAGITAPGQPDPPPREDVEAVSGALMLVPRAAFEQIGGFDEVYFLHFEDLDLCRRMRTAGWRVACANDVRVVHAKGTSSRARPFFVALHKHRGMWRWFVKFDPAARNPLLRALVWAGIWSHYLCMSPLYTWRWLRARFSGSD